MPRVEPIVEVQVTFTVPERVLHWAIAQTSRYVTKRNVDHVIAILVSAHREATVVSVKFPRGAGNQIPSSS